MSEPKSNALTLTCLLAALAVVGGIVFGRYLADRQWDPNRAPQPTTTVEEEK